MYTPSVAPAAEIVTIGDELNRGEIVDTNSSWLAGELTFLGLHVRWRSSTTDDPRDMEAALRLATSRAQVVLTSGGLGPTDDDRTVDVVASIAGVEAVIDEAHRAKMESLFGERGFAVTPNNLRQVRVPRGAEALKNGAGLAPGFRLRLGEAELFSMPGVPREMKNIFQHGIAPRLAALVGGVATAKRVWRVVGMGESHVDHRLRGLLDGVAEPAPTLHFRIAYPETLVTVVARRPTVAEAEAVVEALDEKVRARLGGAVYGSGDAGLAEVVGQRLVQRSETLATAESCTGGLVGELLTEVAGSSRYYLGGVISYSNEVKMEHLGVRQSTLARVGAVSEETAREMAEGVRQRLHATWGLSVTGVAGPGGGTADKPVGLVWIAVAGPSGTEVRRLLYPTTREQIRRISAFAVLNLLDQQLAPERAAQTVEKL